MFGDESKWLRDTLNPEYKTYLERGPHLKPGSDKWDERSYYSDLMARHLIQNEQELKGHKVWEDYRYQLSNDTISGIHFKNAQHVMIEIAGRVYLKFDVPLGHRTGFTMRFVNPIDMGNITPFFTKYVYVTPTNKDVAPTVFTILARDCPKDSLFSPRMKKNMGEPCEFKDCLPLYTLSPDTPKIDKN
jgi:hypothetical protein